MTLAVVLALKPLGWLEPLELSAYDRLVRLQPNPGPDDRIVIVEITEADIRQQNRWPLTDATLTDILTEIQRHNPRNIGLDLYREIQYPPGTQQLRQLLQQPNIFSVTFFGDLETTYVPPPPGVAPKSVGFNDLVIDPDGVVRRQLLAFGLNDEVHLSFALRLALDHGQQTMPPAQTPFEAIETGLILGDVNLPVLPPTAGGYSRADTAGYQILLRYRSQSQAAHRISITELLSGEVESSRIEGKTVLVGVTAPSIKDILPTPYSGSIQSSNYQMPGVEIHANMLSQLLGILLDDQALLGFWPEPVELAWAFFWALLGGVVGWGLKHPLSLALVSLGGIAGNVALAGLLLAWGLWLPPVQPAIAFLLSSALMVAYRGFYAAYHDPLTGLPNRLMFSRYLQQTVSRRSHRTGSLTRLAAGGGWRQTQDSSLAVLFFDLDRFQAINDSFGHDFGDRVLLAVSRRLKRGLKRHRGKIARLGDDEFALLLDPLTSSQEALAVVDQLQQSLHRSIKIADQEIFTTASVGVAFGQPGYTYEPETLLRDAHTATYRAKTLGKARYEVFAHGMRRQLSHRFQTEADLHWALERQELFLNYQPFVDLKSGRLHGFEALVRWNHPERGLVSPGAFIPVAEETGLIIPMGQWILETACRQLALWQRQFAEQFVERPLIMSVNLSSRQFNQTGLVAQIQQVLQDTKVEGHCLKLELTESMVMGDVDSAIAVLLSLKALQIKLGLDDFGTGYSSLSYLHRFPIDTLKIDRSFVMEMEATSEGREIVKTIISLGHNLGMDIIAEGVETEHQARQLRGWACESGQGYYFARPLSVADAEIALAQPQLWTPATLDP